MKSIITIALLALSAQATADEYVNGYYRQDGTYVAPHMRSSPNGQTWDNYSTKGNVNPYTGQQGTVVHETYVPNPYKPHNSNGRYVPNPYRR